MFFLVNSLSGGGTEKVCALLANEVVIRGCNITIFVLNEEQEHSLSNSVTVKFLGRSAASRSLFKLMNIIRSMNDSDSILVFNHELAIVCYWAKLILRKDVKIISRINNTLSVSVQFKSLFYRTVVNSLMKVFYKKIDSFVCQSEGIKKDLINNYNVSGPFTVIHNPIKVQRLNKERKNKELSILYVGRLVKQKNVTDIISAFKELSTDMPNVKLKIVGDGPEKANLEGLAANLSLIDKIEFAGHMKDTGAFFRGATVTVLTSFNEGFPNVLLESLAEGTPVVSYDLPSGPSEIIKHKKNGYLVEHLDLEKLTNSLKEALNRDWDREYLQESISHFDTDVIVDKYISLFEDKIKGLACE